MPAACPLDAVLDLEEPGVISTCHSSAVNMAERPKEGAWLALFPFLLQSCFSVKCEFPVPISLSFFSHCCCHLK